MSPDAISPVRRLLRERTPIRVLMEEKIAIWERKWISKELSPDWDGLKALDFEGEFLRMGEWLRRILSEDPFPAEVNGLFFGFIFPPPGDFKSTVATFLSGSKFYGLDENWARKGDVPDDKFIDHSPLLLSSYRLIVTADVCGDARERAIEFCHLFVSLVVAEWFCSIMRHTLRGDATRRGIFVGFDPWMGFNIGELKPDRPGGSGSVIVSWRGTITGGIRQAEWLTGIRQVANWHECRWNEVDEWDERRLASLAVLRGAPDVPQRPHVRWFDEALTGRILVDPDVIGDEAKFRAESARCGITLDEIEIRGRTHVLLRLKHLEVRGIDFRAFDLRGLYPGEDRMSFALLHCQDAPFLNGCIASLDERAFNRKAYAPPVAEADWYVQSPSVHLRDYGEEWAAELLAWLHYFFAPDFHFSHRDNGAFPYAHLLTQFGFLDGRFGRTTAMELGLRRLHLHFLVEADRAAKLWET